MVPVTHAFYLASLLLLAGLVGLLLRRSLVISLLCLELTLVAAHLALVAASRIWASVDGHALALVGVALMLAQGVVAAGLVLVWRRGPNDTPPL